MKKDKYTVKIENRGKCSEEEVKTTEVLLDYICNTLQKGAFMKIEPKMFYVLKKSEMEDDEVCGFEFTINSSFYKGRIEIRENVEGNYNIYYNKRINTKGKFTYKLEKVDKDIPEEDLISQFDFLNANKDVEDIMIKKGDVVLLENGYIGIVLKYYSNSSIGISYSEDETEPEEYINKSQIIKKLR